MTIHAVQSADMALLQILLQVFLTTGGRDRSGRSVLHWAAIRTDHQILRELLNFQTAAGTYKTRHSVEVASVDIADDFGCTPLHYAVAASSAECVELLLEHGAAARCESYFYMPWLAA